MPGNRKKTALLPLEGDDEQSCPGRRVDQRDQHLQAPADQEARIGSEYPSSGTAPAVMTCEGWSHPRSCGHSRIHRPSSATHLV